MSNRACPFCEGSGLMDDGERTCDACGSTGLWCDAALKIITEAESVLRVSDNRYRQSAAVLDLLALIPARRATREVLVVGDAG